MFKHLVLNFEINYDENRNYFRQPETQQHHKPFGIVTASPGPLGGVRASQQMQLLINALFGIASPYMLIVGGVDKKFDADGNLVDQSFQNNIHNFITEYLWFAESLVKTKMAA